MSAVTIVGSYIAALVMDVACIPLEGETLIGHNFHTTHGGKGSNMAACAARLGAATRFFGKVGRDAFGEGFVRLLEQEKIDKGALLFSDTKPTAVGFIIFSSNGSNVIVIDTAANGEFSPADITAHSEDYFIRSGGIALGNTACHSTRRRVGGQGCRHQVHS
jgi:ribokinase